MSNLNYDPLTKKKELLDSYRPMPQELVHNLDNWFKIELTYTSNAIEGNTLTRHETAVVIEKGLTVGGKSLKEHLEASNHAKALDYIVSLIKKKPSQLSAKDILAIHAIILKGIDDANAGYYRNVPVRIAGSMVVLPNPRKVPDLMDQFQTWLNTKHRLHPVLFAGEAHYKLVTIHPFVDGNGRTARLLMNLLLMMYGYPPAIIRKRDRLTYISSLEKAQLGGSKFDFEKIIFNAVNRSLDIYLQTVRGESNTENLDTDKLLKIGALAKRVDETVATIRYWTQEGLIDIADTTPSGYQLYTIDMVKRCQYIQKLKTKRLTLAEIKTKIKGE